jgi:hypothetical protein
MSLKDVTDLLPCEVARACLDQAYTLAVRASLPPPGVPFFDPESGAWSSPDDVLGLLVSQFEVELRRALGLEFCGTDLAATGQVAA